MRRTTTDEARRIPSFRLTVLVAALSMVAGVSAGQNLVVDPGFENWSDPFTPIDWGQFNGGAGDFIEQETGGGDTVLSGASSLKTTSFEFGFPGVFNDTTNFGFPVSAGQQYEIASFVNVESGGADFTAFVQLDYDSGPAGEAFATLDTFPVDTWVELSAVVTVPAGATFATFSVFTSHDFFTTPTTAAVVYFDDASVTLIPEPTALALAVLGGFGLTRRQRRG